MTSLKLSSIYSVTNASNSIMVDQNILKKNICNISQRGFKSSMLKLKL